MYFFKEVEIRLNIVWQWALRWHFTKDLGSEDTYRFTVMIPSPLLAPFFQGDCSPVHQFGSNHLCKEAAQTRRKEGGDFFI